MESGTTHSVITSCKGPLSKITIPIVGAMGKKICGLSYSLGSLQLEVLN